MHRKAKLILLFYRSWAFASILVTVVCTWLLAKAGLIILPGILLMRAVVSALIMYYMHDYGSRRLYYFANLGMPPRVLWTGSIALDITIFAICMAAAMTYRIVPA